MDAPFWHQRWAEGDIGFHEGKANPLLVAHFDKLNLHGGSRIFLPLCGKTRDIAWLLDQGFRVAGAELSQIAINDLFSELGLQPDITTVGSMTHYHSPNLDIFVGDIFDLSRDVLGAVDAVYDRAALVALPAATRTRYVPHLISLTQAAPQLVITYDYDQQLMAGPPFSVTEAEIRQLAGATYSVQSAACQPVEGGLKGKVVAMETTWVLQGIS